MDYFYGIKTSEIIFLITVSVLLIMLSLDMCITFSYKIKNSS